MPTATRDGVSLYYETEGSGEGVAFVAEAGLGAWSWGWQHRAVAGPYRALVYDHRGTGRSDAPEGPYTVDELAADLRAVVRDAGLGRPHLVGLGLGGMVALRYAREYGARTLTLAGTAASGDRADTDALVDADEADLLSSAFRAANPEVVAGIAEWRAEEDAAPDARRAQAAAVSGFEAGPLYEVTAPALVVHGGSDAVVPVEAGRALAADLPGGEVHTFDGAGHLVTVERSRPVNDRLVGHLEGG
ncbi:MAG: alpha/beta fold hydrolase [Halobacteriaceae archaeon]